MRKVSALLIGCVAVISALGASACLNTPGEDPPPPSGGQNFVLDFNAFASQVDSILTDKGCDNLSCHGGGIRGTYELSPVDNKDIDMDFTQSSLQVSGADPVSSPLLVKPLDEAAGGAAHAGGAVFATAADPGYQMILGWIQTGEYRP